MSKKTKVECKRCIHDGTDKRKIPCRECNKYDDKPKFEMNRFSMPEEPPAPPPKKNKTGHVLRNDGSGLYNTGRKKKDVSREQFEELCKIQCTKPEICAVLGITDRTLDERMKEWYQETFSVVYEELRMNGKASVRRAQFKAAVDDGNVTMLKHLGINLLNQTERSVKEVTERVVYKTDADDLSDEELDKEIAELEKFDDE